jgi:hypothetical protein
MPSGLWDIADKCEVHTPAEIEQGYRECVENDVHYLATTPDHTVQLATSNSITINLNCSAFQTFTSATMDYDGSENYINYLRTLSYVSPQLFSLTQANYAGFLVNGGVNPASLTLEGELSSSNPWMSFSPDLYGYMTIASCTSCTGTGSTITLGGTILGIFAVGQTVWMRNVPAATTISSITSSGPGPAGSNSGDVLNLSQSLSGAVVSGVNGIGTATPLLDAAGTATNSPITAWPAIRMWNGNIGGYLLNRDLDHPANDNSPAFIEGKAA